MNLSGPGVGARLDALGQAFLPAAPVHRQELLAGRTEQLFELLDVARTPGGHAAVFGERGVGKTSVASVFEADLQAQGKRVVRLNCTADDTFASLWGHILDEWLSLGPDDVEVSALTPLLGASVAQASLVRAFGQLDASRPVVVIFDEFDVIADAGVGAEFANLMKAISDKAQSVPVHIVIVGVAEDVDAILMGHASAARGLRQVKLPRLDDGEMRAILSNGLQQLDIQPGSPVEDKIVALAQGLPHYTHLLGKEVARRAILGERNEVLDEDWSDALSAALASAEQKIIDLYEIATTTAKPSMFPLLLIAAALAPKSEQGFFRPTDVHAPLNRLAGKTYALAAFTGNLASLASADRGPALQDRQFADRRKRYRFADPLLQPYVLAKAIDDGIISMDDIEGSSR